jgi:hypothetical protein
MNETDLDIDFGTLDEPETTEETPATPATPEYATRADLDEIKGLLSQLAQPAQRQAAPAPEEEDLDPYAQSIVAKVGAAVQAYIAPLQAEIAESRAERTAASLGIDNETVAKLTEGLTPQEAQYFMKTPAFKNAAQLAAAAKKEPISAPRVRNTNGAPPSENDATMNSFLKALAGEIRW